jgi:hypothetical protein
MKMQRLRLVALRDAYPLGLEVDKTWCIKKGRCVSMDHAFGVTTIKTKWGPGAL